MDRERRNLIMAETGKFMLDIAKLVFGGIILACIMQITVNKLLLLIVGLAFVVAFAFAGLICIALSKNKS